ADRAAGKARWLATVSILLSTVLPAPKKRDRTRVRSLVIAMRELLSQAEEQRIRAAGSSEASARSPMHGVRACCPWHIMPARSTTQVRVQLEDAARPRQIGLLESPVGRSIQSRRKAIIDTDEVQPHRRIRTATVHLFDFHRHDVIGRTQHRR